MLILLILLILLIPLLLLLLLLLLILLLLLENVAVAAVDEGIPNTMPLQLYKVPGSAACTYVRMQVAIDPVKSSMMIVVIIKSIKESNGSCAVPCGPVCYPASEWSSEWCDYTTPTSTSSLREELAVLLPPAVRRCATWLRTTLVARPPLVLW